MFKIKASNGNEREVQTRSEAEEVIDEMEQLGLECEIETVGDGEAAQITEDGSVVQQGGKTDGGHEIVETPSEDPRENTPVEPETVETTQLEERELSENPFDWLPGHYVDHIDGSPAINRQGYAVLAEFYDINVVSDVIVGPEETDFEYCRCEATAYDGEGNEYRAHGSAHVERGDDMELLLEMADTRATKRVLANATGVGAVAVEELKNEL